MKFLCSLVIWFLERRKRGIFKGDRRVRVNLQGRWPKTGDKRMTIRKTTR